MTDHRYFSEKEKEYLDDIRIYLSRANQEMKKLYRSYLKNHETFHTLFCQVKANLDVTNSCMQSFSKNHKSRIRQETEILQKHVRDLKKEEKKQ